MALPTTPKQCAIKIKSLKKQVAAMETRKKKLSTAKKPAKKKVAKKAAKKKVAKKKVSKKKKKR